MKQKTITIEVHSGCVSITRQSKGTTLIIRDYDVDGTDPHLLKHAGSNNQPRK